MRKSLCTVFATVLMVSSAIVAASQVQTTTVRVQTTQNPDGTYSVVEYPVGKETVVTLNPVGIPGTGTATILRDANGTTIRMNVSGLPADLSALNLYAVDPTGAVTMLGPLDVANGVGTFSTTVPLSKFMLFASPEANLTTYGPSTRVIFRSSVPQGFSVIPVGQGTAVGEAVGAAADLGDYAVPMLGIPTFHAGDDTKLKLDFTGAMAGARANVFIEPHKNGRVTEVRMRFHELKDAPAGMSYVLWAVSPNNEFQRLGQITNLHGHNEQEIKSETTFDDFGLLVTAEPLTAATTGVIRPVGHRVGIIQIIR